MKTRKIIQTMTLVISIVTFVLFIKNKKESLLILWMLSFSAASLLFGKLFCGYFCPFHAFDKGWGYLLNIININRIRTPRFMKKKYIYLPLSLILLFLIILKIASLFLPIKLRMPFLMIAFPILMIFTSDLWHNYLCPFSLVMKLPSLRQVLVPKINHSTCKNCNICLKSCPTEAIEVRNKKLYINPSKCILCYRCENECKITSIRV